MLANTYQERVGVLAGGHIHLIEVIRCWQDVEVTIFAPESAREGFCRALPEVRFVSMPSYGYLPWQIDQLSRAPAGAFRRDELREMDALLATSMLPGDIVPALLAMPDRTVVIIHHLFPSPWANGSIRPPAVANWAVQTACLQLIKTFVRSVVFVSPYIMRECARVSNGKRVFLSTNGVRAIPPPADGAPPRSGGIYLGRLHPSKRVEDAIEAWARLPASLGPVPLRIVGGGEDAYVDQLGAAAERLGIADRVTFYGSVTEERKWELLRASQFFVFPSAEEGWGIAIAEAMSAGLPCITYDLPVYHDLFARGRIEVALGNIGALAQACALLLQDPGELDRLAREARTLGAEFTWDKAAHVEMDALQSVMPLVQPA